MTPNEQKLLGLIAELSVEVYLLRQASDGIVQVLADPAQLAQQRLRLDGQTLAALRSLLADPDLTPEIRDVAQRRLNQRLAKTAASSETNGDS